MKKQTLMLVIAIGFGLTACNEKPKHKPGYSDVPTTSEQVKEAKDKIKAAAEEKDAKENQAKIQAGVKAEMDRIAGASKGKEDAAQPVPEPDLKTQPAPEPAPAPVAGDAKKEPKKEEKQEEKKPEILPDPPVAQTPELNEGEEFLPADEETPTQPVAEAPKSEEKPEVPLQKADIVDPKTQTIQMKADASNTSSAVQITCQESVPGAELQNKGILLLPGTKALLATANEKNEDVVKSVSCHAGKKLDLQKDLATTTHQILARGEVKIVNSKMAPAADKSQTAVDVEVKCVGSVDEATSLRGIALLPGSVLSLDARIIEKNGRRDGSLLLGCE